MKYNPFIEKIKNNWNKDYNIFKKYIQELLLIECTTDCDMMDSFITDCSNIAGEAHILLKPKNEIECAIILKICYLCKIPLTISAGRTNLTGSATPKGGAILSTMLLTTPAIEIDNKSNEVISPVGIPLEVLRVKILELSNKKLYYPVDPTSRHDAFVGGTIACNASGFIPGERGATRYWVRQINLLLPNGDLIISRKGQHISENGEFIIQGENEAIKVLMPNYERPKIKNASGPYSSQNGKIDFLDFIIGSEGIFGMITACKLKLNQRPNNYLELFICLKNETTAIEFYNYLFNYFNEDLSQISAMEYFGYNSQNYMKHKSFLFKRSTDVGVYLQIPIHKGDLNSASIEWMGILSNFSFKIDLDEVIVLNDPYNWKKFFEARHSIPDNALRKTKQLGGISIITDTIVPRKNFKKYLKQVHKKLQSNHIEYLLFGHLGDCHLHFHLIPKSNQDNKCLEIYDYLIDLSSQFSGVYSAEHGTGKRKRNDFKKCYGVEAVRMIREAKLSLDPNLLLNKGNVIN